MGVCADYLPFRDPAQIESQVAGDIVSEQGVTSILGIKSLYPDLRPIMMQRSRVSAEALPLQPSMV